MTPARSVRAPGSRGRSRWLLLLGALLLGLAGLGLGARTAAAADNALVASEPGVREQVDQPPGFVTMAFAEEVDPSLAKMLVQDAAGNNVTVGTLVVEGTNLSSQLVDGLAPGTYTVTYRLARSDGEPQGGTFQFSYGPGTFTDAAERTWSGSAAEPEVLQNPDPNFVSPGPPVATRGPSVEPGPRDSSAPPAPSPTSAAAVRADDREQRGRPDHPGQPDVWFRSSADGPDRRARPDRDDGPGHRGRGQRGLGGGRRPAARRPGCRHRRGPAPPQAARPALTGGRLTPRPSSSARPLLGPRRRARAGESDALNLQHGVTPRLRVERSPPSRAAVIGQGFT